MALLMVPEMYSILGLRSVVYVTLVYLCVYGDRRIFSFRIDVWHLCNFKKGGEKLSIRKFFLPPRYLTSKY